jgi:hypothetical protein
MKAYRLTGLFIVLALSVWAVTLSWEAVPCAESYTVCYGEVSGAYTNQVTVYTTEATITNLTPCKTYYFTSFVNHTNCTIQHAGEPNEVAYTVVCVSPSVTNSLNKPIGIRLP